MTVRGDQATYAVEVLQITGSTTLTWGVQTRTLEDPNPAICGDPVASRGVTATGVDAVVAPAGDAAEQLVRYWFYVGGSDSVTNYVIFRALQPSWQADR